MTTERARQALNAWYKTDQQPVFFVKEWDASELDAMEKALDAPDLDAALSAFGIVLGDRGLTSHEQDCENRTDMIHIRNMYG